jgi:glycine/D-amino acid oxidase-like deaminating enzyme
MPDLAGCPVTTAPCVATFTPTAYPYAGFTSSPRIAVLTGGNFVAAKSSDELGRLGAVLMTEGRLGDEDFGSRTDTGFSIGEMIMGVDFKYIIVGRGMMGAAAARHLARRTDGVAVIGPDEPADRKSHSGVFRQPL